MAAGMKQLSKTFVWILMGMLIVGLAGFGAVNFSGSVSSVALVGDEEVSVEEYFRELQREQRSLQQQTGQVVTLAQMTAFGLDRAVLGRLISLAALDNEVNSLGISIGDENLLDELTQIPSFQGPSGNFDREAYRFALQNANLTEAEFEADLRKEAARTLVQGAIISNAEMPSTLADTLTKYIGARRSFSYVLLEPAQFSLIQIVPDDAELKSFYEANPEAFRLPETKQITYARLSPDMILDGIEVDAEALKALYEERKDQYQVPERRLVERLVFSDQAAADRATADLQAGTVTFEELVGNRGLDLQDIDMGDVTKEDLGAAAEGVFAAAVGSVSSPLPSDLGPAIFRINGQLDARITSFEAAEAELRQELAADRARRVIEQQAESIDDILAGGATLEELKDEADMEVATLGWTGIPGDGIAAYEGFRTAADAVTLEDFPAVEFLGDGSIFALRLDEVLPERPEPFDAAKEKVLAAWDADRQAKAITARAGEILTATKNAGAFPDDLEVATEEGLTRTAYLDRTPADMMNQIFTMTPGEVKIITGEDSTVVVSLSEILPAEEGEEMALMREAFTAQLDQALSNALFQAYVSDAQLRAAPRLDQQALNAVQANFQ
ncbi:hypothetical protein RSK20926_19602 [Roseobacter sp. SK209-2-6]|uniref:peptidyl-prolyl cis-trans isomerase n=1 Tax=Roseobacter sp. SK209-2-6 TaxID=388739 RepID=UPI0000F3F613|nr:peptidyl-prolyl cis-trans isomerase [Roseobacter sp. SK209-2-6]EBA17977.1 hypothetical protein RSK20926_19602 [Roseobacter sp. SK209-2-6]